MSKEFGKQPVAWPMNYDQPTGRNSGERDYQPVSEEETKRLRYQAYKALLGFMEGQRSLYGESEPPAILDCDIDLIRTYLAIRGEDGNFLPDEQALVNLRQVAKTSRSGGGAPSIANRIIKDIENGIWEHG